MSVLDFSFDLAFAQLDLTAQMLAAVFVLFVRRFRQPASRPARGILFSFMASSAFYPIIFACFKHGYRQMDLEAGATLYLMTTITYLIAVTIYSVSERFSTDNSSDKS